MLLAGGVLFYALASTGPISTGSGLFALQGVAEQSWLELQPRPTSRASYALDLLDRRTRDLVNVIGQPNEMDILVMVDQTLNQAVLELSNLSLEERAAVSSRIMSQVERLMQITGSLTVTQLQDPQAVAFITKLTDLRGLLVAGTPSVGDLIAISNWRLDTPLPGTEQVRAGFEHPFVLVGRHAEISCLKCHNTTVAPDSSTCATCHESNRPESHTYYEGDCAACHTPAGWQPADFNHATITATQCVVCHAPIRPENHWEGTCDTCHVAGTHWKEGKFDHSGTTSCASCHESLRPEGHYPGDCATCHSDPGGSWKGAKFNHSGASSCTACHESLRPESHYPGDCVDCHTNSGTGWKGAKFNHSGVSSCASCHTSNRPANHFNGDCATCHTDPGGSWKGAKFNHSGINNCTSCHESRRPANHFSGDCATCHKSPGATWAGAKFNHSGITSCASCHTSRRPANHFSGDCATCHKSPGATWAGAKFNHSGINNCTSCHESRRPANHFSGDCATCHRVRG